VTPALSRFGDCSCKPDPFMHGFRMRINVGTAQLVVMFFGDFPANFATKWNECGGTRRASKRNMPRIEKGGPIGPPRFKDAGRRRRGETNCIPRNPSSVAL
jgi:hypothetical protein